MNVKSSFVAFMLSWHCDKGYKWRLSRGGDTRDFGHAFSNRTHFRACGWFWL